MTCTAASATTFSCAARTCVGWPSELGDPVGMWAYEALRIAAHDPRAGLDTDDRTLPHEVGWIGTAVHLDKGCYRGQETVARVHNVGHPPRRLVLLHLDGSVEQLPAHGDPVEADGQAVGAVGSAARHHELGPIGLAVIKRTVPVDADLTGRRRRRRPRGHRLAGCRARPRQQAARGVPRRTARCSDDDAGPESG